MFTHTCHKYYTYIHFWAQAYASIYVYTCSYAYGYVYLLPRSTQLRTWTCIPIHRHLRTSYVTLYMWTHIYTYLFHVCMNVLHYNEPMYYKCAEIAEASGWYGRGGWYWNGWGRGLGWEEVRKVFCKWHFFGQVSHSLADKPTGVTLGRPWSRVVGSTPGACLRGPRLN